MYKCIWFVGESSSHFTLAALHKVVFLHTGASEKVKLVFSQSSSANQQGEDKLKVIVDLVANA